MGDVTEKDGAGKEEPPSLEEFSDRLNRMRGDGQPERPSQESGAAWGRALRISSDLLAGLLVGTALGWGLDRWLDTSPWFLLIGIGVGFAAGIRNMMRTLEKS